MRKRWLCRRDSDGGLHLIDISEGAMAFGADAPSLFIHQDTIDQTINPLDGKLYDSKSAFRRTTRAHGGREIGNDWFHKDGTINHNAISSSRERTESVKDTLIKVYKGEYERDR